MESKFRIEKKESFRILGYAIETTNKRREATKAIPAFWQEFRQNHLEEQLLPLNHQEPYGVFGISVYNLEEDARKFTYFIATSSDMLTPKEMKEYIVPANTWAVFPCTIETIAKTEVQAIMKWLPRSNYKPLNAGYMSGKMKSEAPDIQYYGKDGLVEVWVAVRQK